MIKLLKRLEKNKPFWYLLGILVVFFILRLPSLIEPYWYGDEGIYQTIGMALRNGQILYSGIWDNKPPLLYLGYALFNGDQFSMRLLSLIFGLSSVVVFFKLAQNLLSKLKPTFVATGVFAFFFATPFLEGNIANAENFMLLPIITAGLIIYKTSQRSIISNKLLLTAGLLLGLSFLTKIVAIFDLLAFLVFIVITNLPEKFPKNFEVKSVISSQLSLVKFIIIGFTIPIGITIIYFIAQNSFLDFFDSVFFSNIFYVGLENNFIIPQGLLILKLILLAGFIFFIFSRRSKISKNLIFIFLWFAFSFYNAYFSGRPYTHYALLLLPSFSLLTGFLFLRTSQKIKTHLLLLIVISIFFLDKTFNFNYKKPFLYYENNFSYITGQKNIDEYRTFFDPRTPTDYYVASYIKKETEKNDDIFIWGDSPQIYAISEKIPPGRYTVAYHIKKTDGAYKETQEILIEKQPKLIISLNETGLIPFYLPMYTDTIRIGRATIYERIN